MKVIDRLVDFKYVIQADRGLPVEEQTVWTLKGLPYDIQQALEAKVTPLINMPGSSVGDTKMALSQASVSVSVYGGRAELQFDILKNGIVGVENLKDSRGAEVQYPGSAAPALALKAWFSRWIPSDVRMELANEIISQSTLTEEDSSN